MNFQKCFKMLMWELFARGGVVVMQQMALLEISVFY